MARPDAIATETLAQLFRADDGIGATCSELLRNAGAAAPPIPILTAASVLEQYISADMAEKGAVVPYPVVYVYCDKLVNSLTEKFRTFAGTARMNIDVRVTHDRIADLQKQLQLYVEAITEVLHRRRGNWGGGVLYTGCYEIAFGAVKRGGKNYLQSAVNQLEVHISVS